MMVRVPSNGSITPIAKEGSTTRKTLWEKDNRLRNCNLEPSFFVRERSG
jgi:hypothetical protein